MLVRGFGGCDMSDFNRELAIRSIDGAFQFFTLEMAAVASVILISVHFCDSLCVCCSCCCLIDAALSLCILQFSHIIHQNSIDFLY